MKVIDKKTIHHKTVIRKKRAMVEKHLNNRGIAIGENIDYTCIAKIIIYIFSGKERNLNIVELLCANCSRWFHESCIGYQLGKLVPFLANYCFICKNCSPTGLESFKKNQARKLKKQTNNSK